MTNDTPQLQVPDPIVQILDRFDRSNVPCSESELATAIRAAWNPDSETPSGVLRGAIAEHSAFLFVGRVDDNTEPWGIPFTSPFVFANEEGREVHKPDIGPFGAPEIERWIARAGQTQNPVMKARYLDLAWCVGGFKRLKPDIAVARGAIDSYLAVVDGERHECSTGIRHAVKRGLRLALSIRDAERTSAARAMLLRWHAQQMEMFRAKGHGWVWDTWDELTENNRTGLTQEEREGLLNDLEAVLASSCGPARPDTDGAESSAVRLIAAYTAAKQPDEVHRVRAAWASCLEAFAAGADAMLAIDPLTQCADIYRQMGSDGDADRIQRLIEEKVAESHNFMSTFEVRQEISKETIEHFVAKMCDGDLPEVLTDIADEFVLKRSELLESIDRGAQEAPLMSMITKTLFAADHVAGKITSDPDDELGRLLFEASRHLPLATVWLLKSLQGAKNKFGITPEMLVDYLNSRGLFGADTQLLLAGLRAWQSGDHIAAMHILIPQIERAVREMLSRIGKAVTRGRPRQAGIGESIALGGALNDEDFKTKYGPDVQLHLLALYADSRGWNLRNRVAHGLMHAGEMHEATTVWVIHTLLLMARSVEILESGGGSENPPALVPDSDQDP